MCVCVCVCARASVRLRVCVIRSYQQDRCDGLERQPVQNVVLLPFIAGLCLLHMTRSCQRLAHAFCPQFTSLECLSTMIIM